MYCNLYYYNTLNTCTYNLHDIAFFVQSNFYLFETHFFIPFASQIISTVLPIYTHAHSLTLTFKKDLSINYLKSQNCTQNQYFEVPMFLIFFP